MRYRRICTHMGCKVIGSIVARIFPYSLGRKNPSPSSSLSNNKPNHHTFLLHFAGVSITSSVKNYLLSLSAIGTGHTGRGSTALKTCLHLHPSCIACGTNACSKTLRGDPLTSGVELEGFEIVFQRHRQCAHPEPPQVLELTT